MGLQESPTNVHARAERFAQGSEPALRLVKNEWVSGEAELLRVGAEMGMSCVAVVPLTPGTAWESRESVTIAGEAQHRYSYPCHGLVVDPL